MLYTVPFKAAQVKKNEEGLTFLLSHNPFLGKIFIIQTLRRKWISTQKGYDKNVTLCNECSDKKKLNIAFQIKVI